jgi:hypothetical protein
MYRKLAMLIVAGLVCVLNMPSTGQEGIVSQLYGNGVHAYFAGQYEEAYEFFSSAIQAGTRDPRIYYFRGLTYLKLGRPEEAQQDFVKGAELETADVNQLYPVGRALQRVQGKHRLMLEQYREEARLTAWNRQRAAEKARYQGLRQRVQEGLRQQAEGAKLPPSPPPPIEAPSVPPEKPSPPPFAEQPAEKLPTMPETKVEEMPAEKPTLPSPFEEKPAEKPATEPAEKPEMPAESPAEKPAEKPASPFEMPGEKPAEKPTLPSPFEEKPAEKPATEPAEKPEMPAESPAEKPAEKPASPFEMPGEKPAEKPTLPSPFEEKPAEKPATEPAEKPEMPAESPAEKPAEKPAEEPAEKPKEGAETPSAEKPGAQAKRGGLLRGLLGAAQKTVEDLTKPAGQTLEKILPSGGAGVSPFPGAKPKLDTPVPLPILPGLPGAEPGMEKPKAGTNPFEEEPAAKPAEKKATPANPFE